MSSRPSSRPRRHLLALALLGLAGTPVPVLAAAPSTLTRPRSLVALLGRSQQRAEPLLALFSRPDCPWCEALRRDQLQHLARDAQTRQVQVVEFEIVDSRPFTTVVEASASSALAAWWRATSPSDLAARLSIRVAPTVAFLGPGGELAERLIGYPSRDFYGAYLDERLTQARQALATRRD